MYMQNGIIYTYIVTDKGNIMKRFFRFSIPLLLILICTALFSCGECDHSNVTSSVVPPTCDKEGYTQNTCEDCGAQFTTDHVAPTGHSEVKTVFASTCTDEGYTYYSCDCGYSYKADFTAPLGHTYEKAVTAPTCEAEGFTLYTCACGYSYKADVVTPTGHQYVTSVVAAKCESEGYTLYNCSVCQHEYKGNIVSATGHSLSSETFIPTPERAGYTKYTCSACSLSYHGDILFYSDIFESAFTDNTAVLARGIDVSKWQHETLDGGATYLPLDWVKIKEAGIDFAILKAGSKHGIEPTFEMDYAAARAAGIELGAYFYTYAKTVEELDAEVELLLGWLEGKQFEYPIYFDIEDGSLEDASQREAYTRLCMRFVTALRNNGYYGAIYSNENWLTNYLEGDTLKNFCDVWYSRPPRLSEDHVTLDDVNFVWNESKYGKQMGMWQYTYFGVIPESCIAEGQTVDFNFAYKDYGAIMKKYNLNGFTLISNA